MDNIKILILGHKGKIGSRLSVYLKDSGYNTIFYEDDVNNLEDFRNFISNNLDITHVINLIGSFRGEKSQIFDSNVKSINSVFNILSKLLKDTKVIHFSTGGLYSADASIKSEKDIPNPVTYYTFCKYLGEQIVSFYKKDFDITILRLGAVYGEGITDGFVYNMEKSAKEIGKIKVIGSLKKIRSIVNVEYLLEFTNHLIKNTNNKHEIINVATETITLSDYVEFLKNKYKELEIDQVEDNSDNDKLANMNLGSVEMNSILIVDDKFKLKI